MTKQEKVSFALYSIRESAAAGGEPWSVDSQDVDQYTLDNLASSRIANRDGHGRRRIDYQGTLLGRLWHVKVTSHHPETSQ